ncbi:DUF202 domain-containing protein [Variovorax sp. LjRoot84]|uniref:DUF202 domain-containing protein n=1 Tax=unclassified Variovorax TaxID=663243 RepID=UPI003ECD9706
MRDPGLQPERTVLAWGRTALSVLVNAALYLRLGLEGHRWGLTLSGVFLLLGACLLRWIALRRRNELDAGGVATAPSSGLMSVTVCLVLVSAASAFAVVWR